MNPAYNPYLAEPTYLAARCEVVDGRCQAPQQHTDARRGEREAGCHEKPQRLASFALNGTFRVRVWKREARPHPRASGRSGILRPAPKNKSAGSSETALKNTRAGRRYKRSTRSRRRRDALSLNSYLRLSAFICVLFYFILLYSLISFRSLSASSARGTRTCSMESRKRRVTVPSSLDW